MVVIWQAAYQRYVYADATSMTIRGGDRIEKNDPISDLGYASKKAIVFVRHAPHQGAFCVCMLLILIGFVSFSLGVLAMWGVSNRF